MTWNNGVSCKRVCAIESIPQTKKIRRLRSGWRYRITLISHSLSFCYVEGCPCGAVYPPPSARPFFKGLLSCHVKAPLVKTTKREYPRIVISSVARNFPCTPVKQQSWDDDKRNTPGDASDNDTKKHSSHITSPPPALNPSPLYAKIELSLISLLIKSIAGIGFS